MSRSLSWLTNPCKMNLANTAQNQRFHLPLALYICKRRREREYRQRLVSGSILTLRLPDEVMDPGRQLALNQAARVRAWD